MKEKDFNNIEFPINWGTKKRKTERKENRDREVIGFDTETYEGKVTIFADSLGNYVIPETIEELLFFFDTYANRYKDSLNFFFNLEYDFNAIIKHLPNKNIFELIELERTKYKEYELFYIKEKFFKIVNNKRDYKIKFFDIAHFYHLGSLENTYYEVFKKKYKKIISDRTEGFKIEDIDDRVIDYCIEDALKCQELADNFVKLCNSFVYVKDFYSPASLSKALFKEKVDKYGVMFKKNELQQFALRSFQGGRFETFKRGCFKDIYIYDINSAFPSVLVDLPIPKGLTITNKRYMKDSLYSYFKCDIKIDLSMVISPLKFFIQKKNLLVYPLGTLKDVYLTKKEYEFIDELPEAEIKIKKAKHIFNKNPIYPFRFINDLYNKRLEYKKEKNKMEFIIKIALNSAYGINIQLNHKIFLKDQWKDHEEVELNNEVVFYDENVYLKAKKWIAGKYFNPIYATEITANARLKLLKDSMKNQDHVIMFASDSIFSDKKLINLSLTDKLGDYKQENKRGLEGVVLGNGIYQFFDEIQVKRGFRGFDSKTDINKLMEDNMSKSVIDILKKKPRKLKESKTNLKDLNKFQYFNKQLNINCDNKRNWERDFIDCEDVFNSQINSTPLVI